MASLFDPFTLKDVTLKNRIAVSPMCQYSAENGVINGWHHAHLAGLARGGSGLVIAEATAVSPEGRITPGCAGLWSDAQADAFVPAVRAIKAAGAVPGIQLAHAGRKASANRPWEGDDHIPADDPRAWEPIAPSAVPYGRGLARVPRAMTRDDIARVQHDYVTAARRAPVPQASNGWSCTSRMATSRRASSRRTRIAGTTNTAAASRTASAS
jgi:2,4-dienoyl-CoA reductase-like NADH-dependent reductase (Old Yellow Enzyme family)